jgi:hypothetical protein
MVSPETLAKTAVRRTEWFGGVSHSSRLANQSGTRGHAAKETITCKTVLIRKGASLSATWTTVATNGPGAALREPTVYRAHG